MANIPFPLQWGCWQEIFMPGSFTRAGLGKGIPVQSSLGLAAICRLVLAHPKAGWQRDL